jgi:hypothetical protein
MSRPVHRSLHLDLSTDLTTSPCPPTSSHGGALSTDLLSWPLTSGASATLSFSLSSPTSWSTPLERGAEIQP